MRPDNKRQRLRAMLALLLLMLATKSLAHSVGESYLFLTAADRRIEAELQLRLADLSKALEDSGLTQGELTPSQVEEQFDWVQAYIERGIHLRGGGERYRLRYVDHEFFPSPVGEFFRFHLAADTERDIPDELQLDYALILDADPDHKALVMVRYSDKTDITNFSNEVALTLDAATSSGTVDLTESVRSQVFFAFVREGAEHILEGLDHVLFLISLVLLSVVVAPAGTWVPVKNFRPAFVNVVKIVTLFTVAHTVTLSLAALGYVQLPARLVESIIAASVAFVALNGIYPMVRDGLWTLVFGFGLFHGLGFAGNLDYLGLARGSLLYPLVGFNVGVELGQLALVALSFPVVYALSRKSYYVTHILRFGAGAVALIALLWLTERVFDVNGLAPG